MSVPLDTAVAESRYCADTQNALTLLERALTRLEAEHQQLGKAAEFAVLSPALTAERGDIP